MLPKDRKLAIKLTESNTFSKSKLGDGLSHSSTPDKIMELSESNLSERNDDTKIFSKFHNTKIRDSYDKLETEASIIRGGSLDTKKLK